MLRLTEQEQSGDHSLHAFAVDADRGHQYSSGSLKARPRTPWCPRHWRRADSAYRSAEIEVKLKARGLCSRIHQRASILLTRRQSGAGPIRFMSSLVPCR